MRVVLLALALLSWSPTVSRAAGWSNNIDFPAAAPVVDEANLLDASERQRLGEILANMKAKGGVEMAVYVARDLRERPIEDFALAAAEHWKLGTKKIDKGILFVVAPKEKKMRFEVGYGLEGEITDVFSRRVLDNEVRPYFREGRYFEGIATGVVAVQEQLGIEAGYARPAPGGPRQIRMSNLLFFGLVVFFILISLLRAGTGSSYRRRYGGGGFGGWGGGGGGLGGWGGGRSSGGGFGSWGGGGGGFGGGGSSSSW